MIGYLIQIVGWGGGRHSVIENSDDLPETGRHLGRKPLMSNCLRAPKGATHQMLKRDLFPPHLLDFLFVFKHQNFFIEACSWHKVLFT